MAALNRKQKTYSVFELVLGNLAILLWIILGATSFGLFYPLASIGYFLLLTFLVFFELGKHGCLTCYYCKICTIGLGKLPEFFFKQAGAANVNRKAQKLFPLVFILLSLVPLFLVFFSIIQELVLTKLVLFIAILFFSLYTGTIRRKTLLIDVNQNLT
jgi:hypothetical protein